MSERLMIFATAAVLSVSIAYGIYKLRKRYLSGKEFRECKRTKQYCNEKAESVMKKLKQLQVLSVGDFQRIHFRDEMSVMKKLAKMFEDGLSKLQVITDFDRTLTKARALGKSVPSTHGILEHYPDFTSDTKQKFLNLRDHYLPIEFDPNLSDEQKVPYMEEWWNQSHGELIRSGVKRHLLSETVASANVVLRDGAPDFLAKTRQLSVPVLIFSAGIGNVIEEILQRFECCFDNIQVASNYMNFNKQGELIGFQSDLIHTYNKSVASCTRSEFCVNNSARHNVLLFGDSTGDSRMADGAVKSSEEANVLRIGFLNVQIEESLKLFKERFDIILVDDSTFDVPNLLLEGLAN